MKEAEQPKPAGLMRWLVIAVVILAALLLGVGGLTIAPPLSSQPAAYLADRNLGLAILLLVLLAIRWTRALAAVLLTTAIIHVVDAVADVYFQSPAAVIGSVVVAILSILAAAWLLKQPTASS
jgi:hypothetical protein